VRQTNSLNRSVGVQTSATIVFHNSGFCDGPSISPVVSNYWNRPVVELLLASEAPFRTNDVDLACARFVGWCFSQSDLDVALLAVRSIATQPDLEENADRVDWSSRLASWYQSVMSRLGACEEVVLVNLGHIEITRGGVTLWRPMSS
jgi:hypothetical protein